MKWLVVMPILMATLFGATVSADEVSLAGAWKLATDVAGVRRERTCSFEQKGASFSGACKNEDGSVSVTGNLNGDNVTFQYEAEIFGQKFNSVCTGKLSGAKVIGALSLPAVGVEGGCALTRP